MKQEKDIQPIIMGAGPAGLTAAYELYKRGVRSLLLEKDNIVGGIARTATYKKYRFDIGGHRFFTKVSRVERMWHEVLTEQFLRRPRLSRIYYRGIFFHYPLKPWNALFGLGIWHSFLCGVSYAWAQLFPIKDAASFEDWTVNQFGRRLFNTFFKTYTEKVWGIPCDQIRAEWAAQRIKGLSLFSAVVSALRWRRSQEVIKTLIEEFDYPRLGPGQMWETVTEILQQAGTKTLLKQEVTKVCLQEGRVVSVETGTGTYVGTHFFSTLPIRELIAKMDQVPAPVRQAAEQLRYRDFITVALVINRKELWPDNWIYIHDPTVKLGRVQNFKNWSPDMVPDANKTCLGLEYFCFEGDELWQMSDQALIALGQKEIEKIGLVEPGEVVDGTVVRMPKAYPMYDQAYKQAIETVRAFVDVIPNLYLVGRNGLHKYNNQDHSMLTAMLAVENIFGAGHNIWEVNVDEDYHEEVKRAS